MFGIVHDRVWTLLGLDGLWVLFFLVGSHARFSTAKAKDEHNLWKGNKELVSMRSTWHYKRASPAMH